MRDSVAAAISVVPRARFATWPDGRAVRQVSNPALVERMLRLLEVAPQDRVLEIGTGSGYSTMLLSVLVCPSGRVVSLDVDGELVARARRLVREAGATNVTLRVADGRAGYVAGAPFDRLVAWASLDAEVPPPWPAQVREGGTIVAPFADGNVRKLRVRTGGVHEEAAIEGGFVPLTAAPFRPWNDAAR